MQRRHKPTALSPFNNVFLFPCCPRNLSCWFILSKLHSVAIVSAGETAQTQNIFFFFFTTKTRFCSHLYLYEWWHEDLFRDAFWETYMNESYFTCFFQCDLLKRIMKLINDYSVRRDLMDGICSSDHTVTAKQSLWRSFDIYFPSSQSAEWRAFDVEDLSHDMYLLYSQDFTDWLIKAALLCVKTPWITCFSFQADKL